MNLTFPMACDYRLDNKAAALQPPNVYLPTCLSGKLAMESAP